MIYAVNPEWRTHRTTDVNRNNDGLENVLIGGWVQQIRDKGSLVFLTIRDPQGICQVTIHENKVEQDVWQNCKKLSLESVVSIKGTIKSDPRSQLGAELIPSSINILSQAALKFPIDLTKMKTQMDIDTIFRFRELSIRDPKVSVIMELKSLIANATRNFFSNRGFTEIFTPFILTASTEGGAEQFKLDYFGESAVLAQSCQFYKQAALSLHEKVFGIIPSWRAEKSHTPKHMTEFWQVENEIAFATDKEIMDVQEDYIIYVMSEVTQKGAHHLEQLNRNISVPVKPFKRIPFNEAKSLVLELGIDEEIQEDLGAPGETALSKTFKEPFFITKFPTHLRGMYYAIDPNDPNVTASLDLIAPEGFGELSSGGQRVFEYHKLKQRIIQNKLNLSDFDWYLRMFEYGMPPHAGFGLGFERLIRWIANLPHIREASMFPRTPELYKP